MLQWLIHFLQGPAATQTEPSPLQEYLVEQELRNESFPSRLAAQQEAKRVRFVRDGCSALR